MTGLRGHSPNGEMSALIPTSFSFWTSAKTGGTVVPPVFSDHDGRDARAPCPSQKSATNGTLVLNPLSHIPL